MSILDLFRWRTGRRRVAATARDLLDAHGDRAFFESHEAAWRAAGDGRDREARFHRAVSLEISRVLQRRAILEAIMAPSRPARPSPRRAQSRRAAPAQLFVDMNRVAR
ncbi:MAG: hypothetical protein MEP57_03865 [Microvirga sp.]|nr:hypothetical protein [Microvirga sp.]